VRESPRREEKGEAGRHCPVRIYIEEDSIYVGGMNY
jgi:hypothetical protein